MIKFIKLQLQLLYIFCFVTGAGNLFNQEIIYVDNQNGKVLSSIRGNQPSWIQQLKLKD